MVRVAYDCKFSDTSIITNFYDRPRFKKAVIADPAVGTQDNLAAAAGAHDDIVPDTAEITNFHMSVNFKKTPLETAFLADNSKFSAVNKIVPVICQPAHERLFLLP
jgi:hypothetical protein